MQGYEEVSVSRGWSKTARKHITAISKGIAEILAALAEPTMRYATVYLALATSIKAIHVVVIYNVAQGIVISAPEFVLLGALAIAEHAWRDGRRVWPLILFGVCVALAAIMVTTFVDIFIVSFSDSAIKALNFARCLTAVGFSIALNKLDDEKPVGDTATTQIAATPGISDTPSPDDSEEERDTSMLPVSPRQDEGGDTPVFPATSDSYGDNKLAATLAYLRRHPGADDEELAAHLGLKKPVSARFWRLKAGEMLSASAQHAQPSTDPEIIAMPALPTAQHEERPRHDNEQTATAKSDSAKTTQNDPRHGVHLVATPRHDKGAATAKSDSKQAATGGDTATRINQYRVANPNATTKDVATALNLSQRTVQRHWTPVPLVAVQ